MSPHGRRALGAAWALDFGPNMGNPFARASRGTCACSWRRRRSGSSLLGHLPLCRAPEYRCRDNDAALRRHARSPMLHAPGPSPTTRPSISSAFDAALAGARHVYLHATAVAVIVGGTLPSVEATWLMPWSHEDFFVSVRRSRVRTWVMPPRPFRAVVHGRVSSRPAGWVRRRVRTVGRRVSLRGGLGSSDSRVDAARRGSSGRVQCRTVPPPLPLLEKFELRRVSR